MAVVLGAFGYPLLENHATDKGWLGIEDDRFGWLLGFLTDPLVSGFITATLAASSGFFIGRHLLGVIRDDGPDQHIRATNRELISAFAGLEVMGSTPLARQPLTRPADPEFRTGLYEAYSALTAHIERWMKLGGAKVLLVTSVYPGEGKTTTALSVAQCLQLSGHRVLLIDGDNRNPSLHRLLSVPASPGLSNAIAGAWSGYVTREGTPRFLLPAGLLAPDPGTLMAGIGGVINKLKGEFDYIIVDSPPGFFADNIRIADAVDHILVVVRYGALLFLLRSFVQFLEQNSGKPMFGVFTQRPLKQMRTRRELAGGYDGYDYAYDYSYAVASEATDALAVPNKSH